MRKLKIAVLLFAIGFSTMAVTETDSSTTQSTPFQQCLDLRSGDRFAWFYITGGGYPYAAYTIVDENGNLVDQTGSGYWNDQKDKWGYGQSQLPSDRDLVSWLGVDTEKVMTMYGYDPTASNGMRCARDNETTIRIVRLNRGGPALPETTTPATSFESGIFHLQCDPENGGCNTLISLVKYLREIGVVTNTATCKK